MDGDDECIFILNVAVHDLWRLADAMQEGSQALSERFQRN